VVLANRQHRERCSELGRRGKMRKSGVNPDY
jgi:hypothetical protein